MGDPSSRCVGPNLMTVAPARQALWCSTATSCHIPPVTVAVDVVRLGGSQRLHAHCCAPFTGGGSQVLRVLHNCRP